MSRVLEMHKLALTRKTKDGLVPIGGQLPMGVRSASQRKLSSAVAAIANDRRRSLLRPTTTIQVALPQPSEEVDVSLTPLHVKARGCKGPIHPLSTTKMTWDLFQVRAHTHALPAFPLAVYFIHTVIVLAARWAGLWLCGPVRRSMLPVRRVITIDKTCSGRCAGLRRNGACCIATAASHAAVARLSSCINIVVLPHLDCCVHAGLGCVARPLLSLCNAMRFFHFKKK